MTFILEPLTKEQSADIAAVLRLNTEKHGLGDDWPRHSRTAYDIGYADAILKAAELLSARFAERTEKEIASP